MVKPCSELKQPSANQRRVLLGMRGLHTRLHRVLWGLYWAGTPKSVITIDSLGNSTAEPREKAEGGGRGRGLVTTGLTDDIACWSFIN